MSSLNRVSSSAFRGLRDTGIDTPVGTGVLHALARPLPRVDGSLSVTMVYVDRAISAPGDALPCLSAEG